MDDDNQERRLWRQPHDLAYVLGEGASIGRSRIVRDALSVAPLIFFNSVLNFAIYLAIIVRDTPPRWDGFWLVAASLTLLPLVISFVLVSLRDHSQPLTVATFVTGVAASVVIAVLSATRTPISYSGVLLAAIPTAVVAVVIMLRLNRAQTEHVALLDFPGSEEAVAKLGGNIPVIGSDDADLGAYDRYLIDIAEHHSSRWSRFLLRSYMRGVLVTPWVQFLEIRRGRVDIDSFDPTDIVLSPSQILYSRAKRVTDIAGVLVTAPLTIVLGGLTALYILIRAGRPVLFTQQRRGFGGRSFTLYKFRTMQRNADSAAAQFTTTDRRVVPGLDFLRTLRLDELPQLINILKGDMSIVGPRPETLELARNYEAELPRYVDRLLVRPGLTGWAQVNATASMNVEQAREKLAYDLYYIKNMSIDLDLLIVARTFRTLFLKTLSK